MVVQARLSDIEYRVFYRPHDNPLETFYLPTWRPASTTTAAPAFPLVGAGGLPRIVRLIYNGGRMRLLVGAELAEQDVAAIKTGTTCAIG